MSARTKLKGERNMGNLEDAEARLGEIKGRERRGEPVAPARSWYIREWTKASSRPDVRALPVRRCGYSP